MDINALNQEMLACMKETPFCEKQAVMGEGRVKNPVVFMIGEAPGGEEERLKRPFVGKAGKNLDEFLNRVHLKREEIYISNVVKIRPTNILSLIHI